MLLISANSFQATQIVCGLQGLLKALAQCSHCSDIISHPIPCIITGCHQSYLLWRLTKHICAWSPCFFQLYGIFNNSLQETVMMSNVIVFNGTTSPEVHKDNPGGWCAGSPCSSLGAVRRRWWPCCWGTSPCPGRPTLPRSHSTSTPMLPAALCGICSGLVAFLFIAVDDAKLLNSFMAVAKSCCPLDILEPGISSSSAANGFRLVMVCV